MTKPNLTEAQRAEIERWCAELESGKWAQADGVLKSTDQNKHEPEKPQCLYCCLGVYPQTCPGGGRWELGSDGRMVPFVDDERVIVNGAEHLAYDWMEKRTGITHREQSALAVLNDNGVTFPDIARALRNWVETGHVVVPGTEVAYHDDD